MKAENGFKVLIANAFDAEESRRRLRGQRAFVRCQAVAQAVAEIRGSCRVLAFIIARQGFYDCDSGMRLRLVGVQVRECRIDQVDEVDGGRLVEVDICDRLEAQSSITVEIRSRLSSSTSLSTIG